MALVLLFTAAADLAKDLAVRLGAILVVQSVLVCCVVEGCVIEGDRKARTLNGT